MASEIGTEIRRICIFPEVLQSGIGRYAINLTKALSSLGVEVDLFLTRDQGDLIQQAPKEARLIMGGGSTKKSLKRLHSYLREEKPDALITAHNHVNVSSIWVNRLALSPTRVMITLHTAMSKDDHSLEPRKKRLIRELCRFSYPLADHIVAVSEAVADDTAQHLSLQRQKIAVAYNPVFSQAMLQRAEEAVSHPFFNQEAPIFISIGRLTEQKDYFTLIRAFAQVRVRQKAKLLILGEGEDRGRLEALTEELGLEDDVALPGFLDNPYAYLKRSDVFVSSSAWEGLPTVVIEALALGKAVVATDCPGGTAEILEGGQYGHLVEVANPVALAQAMLASLEKTWDAGRLAKRGADFSLEASAKRYLELLGLSS
ncbi:MAG: glycosyltransferase [Trueperaceae bacterium]|nr:glycosyltransferase [Trueperaceae bacterium]